MLDGYFGFAAWPVPFVNGTAEYTEIDSLQLHHSILFRGFFLVDFSTLECICVCVCLCVDMPML